MMLDLQPCCLGVMFYLYHRLMLLRNIFYLMQHILFYMYQQLGVGILLGLLSYL